MANQKITEVGEVNSLNFSDNIFVNSSNTLRQMPLSDIFANRGGVSMEVLWENPNPAAEFAAQDITLSNTANLYVFLYKNYNTGATSEDACFSIDEELGGTMHIKSAASTTSNNYYTRNFTRDGATISFANCYRKTFSSTSAGSMTNTYIIPTKVIGLSFGLNNFGIADYIVEQGGNETWLGYRKWNSGVAECWGKFSISTPASASGYAYPEFPFSFSDTNYTVTWGKGNQGTAYISHNEDIFPEVYGKTTTGFTLKTYNTDTTAVTLDVYVDVKGRWK